MSDGFLYRKRLISLSVPFPRPPNRCCRGWGSRTQAIFTNHHHIVSLYSSVAAILLSKYLREKRKWTLQLPFFMPLRSSTCVVIFPRSRLRMALNFTKRFNRNLCLSVPFICFFVFLFSRPFTYDENALNLLQLTRLIPPLCPNFLYHFPQ